MKSNLVLSVVLVLSAVQGCAPSRAPTNSAVGGSTATGGTSVPDDSGGRSGDGGSGGGGASSGGVTGQGGSNAGGAAGAAGGNTNAGGTGPSAGGSAGTNSTSAAGGRGGGAGGADTTPAGGSNGSGGTTGAGGTGPNPIGPCDLYQAGNTPCGAAHSTVRALYSTYTGPLYQVQRTSDKTTKDIVVGPGGFAKTSDQDSFCSGTSCSIPIIYDQSPNGNHLRPTWWGYWMMNGGNPASATEAKITVAGHTVYGIRAGGTVANVGYRTGVALSGTASVNKGSTTVTFSDPQTLPADTILIFTIQAKDCLANSWPSNCKVARNFTAQAIDNATTVTLKAAYQGTSSSSTVARNETTKGIAIDDESEAMYSVFDGKTYSQWCCFDYGNAEMTGIDEGDATMEALYFGSSTQWTSGAGSGPWVAADIENGMFECDLKSTTPCATNTSITGFPYVTGMLKGLTSSACPTGLTNSGCFALKAGNATSGKLEWKWNGSTKNYGARPPGYSPQKKQGAVILATGGDSSNTGAGIWFEGAIARGAVTDATDDAVQANIVALGYGK